MKWISRPDRRPWKPRTSSSPCEPTAPRRPARQGTAYLLDLTSDAGGPKARFFPSRGFSLDGWLSFVEALGQHGSDHRPGRAITTPFGEKYVLIGPMRCPDGSAPQILSVWMLSSDGAEATLVTACPAP